MAMQDRSFRVIVVGGGVAGLTASHCLQKARIDHIVIERRQEVAPPEGASIAIYPHGLRILAQIGCLEYVEKACVPCQRWISRSPEGKPISDNGFFDHMKANHGRDICLLERRRYLQILYDNLPDKTFIRTGSAVKTIENRVDGVKVTLADGTVEEADMILGCDGVNSMVRNQVWDHVGIAPPTVQPTPGRDYFQTKWKALVGMGPPEPRLGTADMTVVHNDHYSFLILTQPDQTFYFAFFRLPEVLDWASRPRYSDQEMHDLAASVGDRPVCENMTFSELWAKRDRGALIPIEEGILDQWHQGRVVLAGDAAHKVTPNIALGGNSGMESVVVLCNHLRRMLVAQQGARPSAATLRRVFQKYQAEQHKRIKGVMEYSGQITSVQAWDGLVPRFMANWVLPLIWDSFVADDLGKIVAGAPLLDYVDCPANFPGRLAWKNATAMEDSPDEKALYPSEDLYGAAMAAACN